MSFAYLRPESLDELLALVKTHGSNARLLAGGTDLLVSIRKRAFAGAPNEPGAVPSVVIDLKKVAAIREDVVSTAVGIRIGARAVMTDILSDPTVGKSFPALAEAALVVGSVQIRNRATLAGNLCNASPAADTAPALLVYGATINVLGASGPRAIAVEEFFAGPGRTALAPGEIVVSIDLPFPPADSGAAFARLTRRQGVDLAIASVCCMVRRPGATAFAAGAVAPRPLLVRGNSVDAALEGLLTAASPISDLRAGEEYRRAMLPILARRAWHAATDRMHQARHAE